MSKEETSAIDVKPVSQTFRSGLQVPPHGLHNQTFLRKLAPRMTIVEKILAMSIPIVRRHCRAGH